MSVAEAETILKSLPSGSKDMSYVCAHLCCTKLAKIERELEELNTAEVDDGVYAQDTSEGESFTSAV